MSKTDALGTICKDTDHDDAVSTTAGSTTDCEATSLQHVVDRALVDALVASLTSKRTGHEDDVQRKCVTAEQTQPTSRSSIVLSEILPEPTRRFTATENMVSQAWLQGPVLSTFPCRVAAQSCVEGLVVLGNPHILAAEGDAASCSKEANQTDTSTCEAGGAETGTQGSSQSEAPSLCTDTYVQSIPSDGSALHHQGRCKPCAFFHRDGCKSDASCKFCHLCPDGEKKKRLKERKKPQRHFWGVIQTTF